MSLPAESVSRPAVTATSVRQLIEERALFTPDEIAVYDADGHACSWHELNARANRLADRLCEQGAGPNRPVGLAGRAGAATLIGWLAALKADAAIVPLGGTAGSDAAHVMRETGARILLNSGNPDEVPGVTSICLNLAGAPPTTPNLGSRSRPDHAVFITAAPAGLIRVAQRDLDDLVRWQARVFDAATPARVCILASTTQLAGLRIAASTLALGGTLYFAPSACGTTPALWDFLQGACITRICLEPEQLDALVSAEEVRGLAIDALRDIVVLGGTLRLTPDVLRFFSIHAPCKVHALHGAHESPAIGACTLELPFAELHQKKSTSTTSPTVLTQAGPFTARVAVPAVA